MNRALDWLTANQCDLGEALARVRAQLQRHAGRMQQGLPQTGQTLPGGEPLPVLPAQPAAQGNAEPFAVHTLCQLFGLSDFERDILLLCAGIEMDARFAPLCAAAQADPARSYPTFALALAALPGAHWSALTPHAPLRAWRLLEASGPSLANAALKIDERVLHYLAGINQMDQRLQGTADVLDARHAPAAAMPPSSDLIERISQYISARNAPAPVAQLSGGDTKALEAIARAVCSRLGTGLLRLRACDLPASAAERYALAHLLAREALLGNSVLLLQAQEGAEQHGTLAAFVRELAVPVIVASQEALGAFDSTALAFELVRPSRGAQLELWHRALGPAAAGLSRELDGVAAQFQLSSEEIHHIAARISGADDPAAPGQDGALLWQACCRAVRPRIETLAQRIEPAATWDDLVLPAVQKQVLRDITTHVRQRRRVYDDWGFAAKGARGLGITALFSGASGTGKTMAAEVLARELHLDLYRIDLATVVSKYIGETEKNLKRLFDAAEGSGAVLLFDEADALFGRRSEVKDSHDRYANIEVSYLLQRMEAYRGLAILTTNLKTALDPAFMRRIRFIVQFPFPDAPQRAEIWRRIFPAAMPQEALDCTRLAQLNVTGGQIRNIALCGAFLAAEAGEPVAMRHLMAAARSEYAKSEKNLTDAEVRGWP